MRFTMRKRKILLSIGELDADGETDPGTPAAQTETSFADNDSSPLISYTVESVAGDETTLYSTGRLESRSSTMERECTWISICKTGSDGN